jgi:hypothetical protein
MAIRSNSNSSGSTTPPPQNPGTGLPKEVFTPEQIQYMSGTISAFFTQKITEYENSINIKLNESEDHIKREIDEKFKEVLDGKINEKGENVGGLYTQIKDLKQSANETKNELAKAKVSTIEALGLFFALFALISSSFQILTKIENLQQALFVELILILALGSFVGFLFYNTRSQTEEKGGAIKKIGFLWLPITSLALVIILIFCFNNRNSSFYPDCINSVGDSDCIVKKDLIDKLVEQKTNEKIDELNKLQDKN